MFIDFIDQFAFELDKYLEKDLLYFQDLTLGAVQDKLGEK